MFQDDMSDNEAHGDEIRIDCFNIEKFSSLTYFANYRTEVLQVRAAAEKTLNGVENLDEDPLWRIALIEILDAKKKQITR
jgi:hypothetical protein